MGRTWCAREPSFTIRSTHIACYIGIDNDYVANVNGQPRLEIHVPNACAQYVAVDPIDASEAINGYLPDVVVVEDTARSHVGTNPLDVRLALTIPIAYPPAQCAAEIETFVPDTNPTGTVTVNTTAGTIQQIYVPW